MGHGPSCCSIGHAQSEVPGSTEGTAWPPSCGTKVRGTGNKPTSSALVMALRYSWDRRTTWRHSAV